MLLALAAKRPAPRLRGAERRRPQSGIRKSVCGFPPASRS